MILPYLMTIIQIKALINGTFSENHHNAHKSSSQCTFLHKWRV